MERRLKHKPAQVVKRPEPRTSDPVLLPPATRASNRTLLAIGAILVFLTFVVFGQTLSHDFVNFDDNTYVHANPDVLRGIASWKSLCWAFTTFHADNWHPLTWLSHMLDAQLYGKQRPGGHHLSNVLLHAITALMLLWMLWRTTGRVWASAFATAVFAIHPLRVESVAWVSERKDLLSGLFFMLTLMAYANYARRQFSWLRYAAVVASFALGLMAKPMLVTLPFLLLLLDYWPLGRWEIAGTVQQGGQAAPRRRRVFRTALRLVLEKTPLFALALASCVVTTFAQKNAIADLDFVKPSWRIVNAVVATVTYMGQLLWPANLAIFYPHPGDSLSALKIAAAATVLLVVSVGAWLYRRRLPYWFVGWFWFLGMLVPVIGLLQVGSHAMADRYTYLPQIGLVLAATWGVADLLRRWPHRRQLAAALAAIAVTAMTACAWRQTAYWRDSETLWNRALACTSQNLPAMINLGVALGDRGDRDGAIAMYRSALQIVPNNAIANNNLGLEQFARGETEAALACYQKAAASEPRYFDARYNMGKALNKLGRPAEAVVAYRKALDLRPNEAMVYCDLGIASGSAGDSIGAIAAYEQAIKLDPTLTSAYYNLGLAYVRQGDPAQAIRCYRLALENEPDHVASLNSLGSALARQGKLGEAMELFRHAIRANPDYVEAHYNLATALKQQGKTTEAIQEMRELVRLKPDSAAEAHELAKVLATSTDTAVRNPGEAVTLATRAATLSNQRDPSILDTLAMAYAANGQFPEALRVGRTALQVARQGNDMAITESIRNHVIQLETQALTGQPQSDEPPKP